MKLATVTNGRGLKKVIMENVKILKSKNFNNIFLLKFKCQGELKDEIDLNLKVKGLNWHNK